MSATSFVIPALPQPSIPVAGDTKSFPVRRIWCVGRNYLEHIREMGNDERAPPFFFAKHADMLVPDGATIPYPPLTKDIHSEVELIVTMKSGGLNIPAATALYNVYTYAVFFGQHTPSGAVCTTCGGVQGLRVLGVRPRKRRRWEGDGHRRAEATPSFERLGPGHDGTPPLLRRRRERLQEIR